MNVGNTHSPQSTTDQNPDIPTTGIVLYKSAGPRCSSQGDGLSAECRHMQSDALNDLFVVFLSSCPAASKIKEASESPTRCRLCTVSAATSAGSVWQASKTWQLAPAQDLAGQNGTGLIYPAAAICRQTCLHPSDPLPAKAASRVPRWRCRTRPKATSA